MILGAEMKSDAPKYFITDYSLHESSSYNSNLFILKSNISSSLSDGCELVEVIAGNKTSLGFANYKTILYLLVEFIEFGINEVNINDKNKENYMKVLSLLRGWIYGEISGPIIAIKTDDFSCIHSAYERYIWEAIYYSCKLTNDDRNNSNYRLAINSTIYAHRHLLANLCSSQESVRQAEYIIDFFKSGKHLFFV
jgi:hypothetical protein